MDQATARRRLLALRERRGIRQQALSDALGFNDRQTLSDIERGNRNLAAAELVRAADFFGVSVDYFTDPLELAGEANFSWRQSAGDAAQLAAFEQQAGRWIATWRHLRRLRGESVNSMLARVDLDRSSSFEEAAAEGEAVCHALELGPVPAATLAGVLEDRWDTLVLHVDAAPGVSGAACQLGPLNAILINRNESQGRRSFDLGHELFHLLTWQQMPPEHVESPAGPGSRRKRIEQLADHFSGGLLMPRSVVEPLLARSPLPTDEARLPEWIVQAAAPLLVSGVALKWRLVGLGLLPRAVAGRLDDAGLRMAMDEGPRPARFSRPFLELLGWGIGEGHLSVRKASSLVGVNLDELAVLFAEHGLAAPFDL